MEEEDLVFLLNLDFILVLETNLVYSEFSCYWFLYIYYISPYSSLMLHAKSMSHFILIKFSFTLVTHFKYYISSLGNNLYID